MAASVAASRHSYTPFFSCDLELRKFLICVNAVSIRWDNEAHLLTKKVEIALKYPSPISPCTWNIGRSIGIVGYVSFAVPSPPSDETIFFTANGCPSYGKLGTPTCSVVLIKRPILLYNGKINSEGVLSQFLLAGLHCSTLSSGWRMFENSLHWQNKRKKKWL